MEALGAAAAVGQFVGMAAKMIDLIARLEDFLKNAPARYQGWHTQLATLDHTISYIRDNTELQTNQVKRIIEEIAPKILSLIKLCERYAPTPKAEWRSRLKKALSAWGVEPRILQNFQSLEQDKTTLLLAINTSSRATTPDEKSQPTSLNMDYQRQQEEKGARDGSRNTGSTYVAPTRMPDAPDTPPTTPTDTTPKTYSRMQSESPNVQTAGLAHDASTRTQPETLPGMRSETHSETHQRASPQGNAGSSYTNITTTGFAHDVANDHNHRVTVADISTSGMGNRVASQSAAVPFDPTKIMAQFGSGIPLSALGHIAPQGTSAPNPNPPLAPDTASAPGPASTPNPISKPNPTSTPDPALRVRSTPSAEPPTSKESKHRHTTSTHKGHKHKEHSK